MKRESTNLVQIGDVARAANVTTRTVRFYEDLGLIRSAKRSTGGFRLYAADQAERLRAVIGLKEVGFSLDEIREFQRLARPGEIAFEVMARLRGKVVFGAAQVRKRIETLERALDDLERAEATLSECDGCEAKLYDSACHDCWKRIAGGSTPDALKAVL